MLSARKISGGGGGSEKIARVEKLLVYESSTLLKIPKGKGRGINKTGMNRGRSAVLQ